MKLTEATQEELQLLKLWEMWQDIILEVDKKGIEKDRKAELLQAHYKEAGIEPPTKRSPLSLMFFSFVGGGNDWN